MSQPDFAGAIKHVLRRLERELTPELVYHSAHHTRDDVLPAVERLAALEQISDEQLGLLRTAAAFHDIGFIEHPMEHEMIGIRIAAETLPRFGFSAAQIREIGGMIGATRLPQTPETLLEQILADADLDVLGRDDFMRRNADLRAELAARGQFASDAAWLVTQVKFLRGHTYFTAAAQRTRAATKQRNLELLAKRLKEAAAMPAS